MLDVGQSYALAEVIDVSRAHLKVFLKAMRQRLKKQTATQMSFCGVIRLSFALKRLYV